ncbi:MAG: globin [Anaerolineae bacterium]|nr:globin [Anaerolineae bacterium]
MQEFKSVYELLGGEQIESLIAAFYRRVQGDPLLRPLYPDADMEGAERRLRLFVIQYFGGPSTYVEERGHPRLRMRHAPFVIGKAERDAWMAAMLASMSEVGIPEPAYSVMREYFENAASFMINQPFGIQGQG